MEIKEACKYTPPQYLMHSCIHYTFEDIRIQECKYAVYCIILCCILFANTLSSPSDMHTGISHHLLLLQSSASFKKETLLISVFHLKWRLIYPILVLVTPYFTGGVMLHQQTMIHNHSHQNQKQQKEGGDYDGWPYPGFQNFRRF